MNRRAKIGSMTAKGGFINETNICKKFLNYKNDLEAKNWLEIMGYVPDKIQNLIALQIPVRINLEKALSLGVSEDKYEETIKFKKADIQIRVEIIIDDIIHIENISLKKSNKSSGFNQIDKRPVSTYKNIWNFNSNIEKWLRLFTGDLLPKNILQKNEISSIRDKRRMLRLSILNG